jgi:hypothetical protein
MLYDSLLGDFTKIQISAAKKINHVLKIVTGRGNYIFIQRFSESTFSTILG